MNIWTVNSVILLLVSYVRRPVVCFDIRLYVGLVFYQPDTRVLVKIVLKAIGLASYQLVFKRYFLLYY